VTVSGEKPNRFAVISTTRGDLAFTGVDMGPAEKNDAAVTKAINKNLV
jgi:hypothetical protein